MISRKILLKDERRRKVGIIIREKKNNNNSTKKQEGEEEGKREVKANEHHTIEMKSTGIQNERAKMRIEI